MPGKKFYITTSIAYTNAAPHIGFALELVQADVLARYHRLLKEKVFFLTGTDEHGTKIVKAAQKSGKDPKQFTDELSLKYKELTGSLNLSNNDFIRTTDQKRHWPSVWRVWARLKDNGDIYKKKYKGFYCVGCEAFVKEKDLVSGLCPIHQQKPEIIEEENYFFKLSKYAETVKKAIEKGEIKITPEAKKNEILSFIDQGVEDISCSRLKDNLSWGVPVSDDPTQTIYIWFEALINYISALNYVENGKEFKTFWPADVHCVGKDIFRFHSLLWPAMLISLGLKLPKNIFVHGYLTSSGQKMSKTLGNVINPFELIEKYGTDPVRYFLLREIPPTGDGDFSFEKFESRYNADLAKGLGNLVSRVITLSKDSKKKDNVFKKEVRGIEKNQKALFKEFKFNEILSLVWTLISSCDRYIEKEKPWENTDKKGDVLANLRYAIENIAEIITPFLPETSERILKQLKEGKTEPLFPRI